MNTTINKAVIISLIRDDLVNAKLANGLIAIDLDASHYQLHLGNTIFTLMGFKEDRYSDSIYELYLELGKKATQYNISTSPEAFDELALEIFTVLGDKVTAVK